MIRLVRLGLVMAIAACTPIKDPMQQAAQTGSANSAGCTGAAEGCGTKATQNATPAQADAGTPEKKDAGNQRAATGTRGLTPPAAPGNQPDAKPDVSPADSGKPASGKPEPSGSPAPTAQPDAGAPATATTNASTTQANAPTDDTLLPPDDSECDYVEIRARNDGAGSAYQVMAGDYLQCFLVDAGFDAPTQAFGFKPLLDNAAIVTDIVLRTLERSENRGPVVTCNDTYPTHQMVAFWAPGADDWYYPKDMGIDLGRGLFLLEVHYDNPGGATSDRSGMRICTSKKLRPRTASMSWLGTRTFTVPAGAQNYAVSGRCQPAMQADPIHILRVFPFMNALGRRATMQVDHIDGTTQLLLDEPFNARDRKIYDTPAIVRVGDSVLSTCYFDNPSASTVLPGTSNDNELCHMLVLAYPAHALVDAAWSVENNSCVGGP